MSVEVDFKVFSVEAGSFARPATLDDGSKVTATVSGVIVQLVPDDPEAHGTVKLTLTGGDAAAAKDTFQVGGAIRAAFSVKE